MTRVLVWQWGRRGAGPRFGLGVARAIRKQPGNAVLLSLSRRAELLESALFPDGELPLWLVETYGGYCGLVARWLEAPRLIRTFYRRLRDWRPDLAVCAMTGPMDLLMAAALHCLDVPFAVIVHDAVPHPGDGFPLQHRLQTLLLRRASFIMTLTRHVAEQLQALPSCRDRRILIGTLPPCDDLFAGAPRAALLRHPGPVRLLMFGRLLAYKGLDLLAAALARLPPGLSFELRVVGSGPDSPELRALAGMKNVTVENRWVVEEEIPALLHWCDAMVLPYREATQSGVGALAAAFGKPLLATDVGGLAEQFADSDAVTLCGADSRSLCRALENLIRDLPDAAPVTPVPSQQKWEHLVNLLLTEAEQRTRDPSPADAPHPSRISLTGRRNQTHAT